jgi:hypothetical protein
VLLACHSNQTVSAADNLLAKKSHKQLLHDYDARRAAAVDFMVMVRPGLAVTAGALSDPQVLGQRKYVNCLVLWTAAVYSMVLVRPGLAVNKPSPLSSVCIPFAGALSRIA